MHTIPKNVYNKSDNPFFKMKKTQTKTVKKSTKVATPEVHIPKEKEIKKRSLLLVSFVTLVLVLGLAVWNNVFTGKQFDIAKENISSLEQVLKTQKSDFQKTIQKFTGLQEEFRKNIFGKINTLETADESIASDLVKLEKDFEYFENSLTALQTRDKEIVEYVEDFQVRALEREITNNKFLIELHEKQIEYLQQQNKDRLKQKLAAVELSDLPEKELPVFEVEVDTENNEDNVSEEPEIETPEQ